MAALLNVPVTTAVTAQVGGVYVLRNAPGGLAPLGITVQGTATGSGGTTMQWWLQTSIDGGTTWCDVASFSHAAAGRVAGTVTAAPQAGVVPAAATDGTLASATVVNLLGGYWRIKYTTTGTWTTGNLRVDVACAGSFAPYNAF